MKLVGRVSMSVNNYNFKRKNKFTVMVAKF